MRWNVNSRAEVDGLCKNVNKKSKVNVIKMAALKKVAKSSERIRFGHQNLFVDTTTPTLIAPSLAIDHEYKYESLRFLK